MVHVRLGSDRQHDLDGFEPINDVYGHAAGDRELNGTPEDAAVTEAVIRLSQALHLTTIAEGIETAEQTAELRGLGCEKGQGYLYAPPLPAAPLTETLFAAVPSGRSSGRE